MFKGYVITLIPSTSIIMSLTVADSPAAYPLDLTTPPTVSGSPAPQQQQPTLPPPTLPIPEPRTRAPKLTKTEAQEMEEDGRELARREYRTIHNKGTVVRSLADDRLFSLVRRFSVQIQHVRAPAHSLPDGELDLRSTNVRDVSFNTTTIQSNLERLAQSLGIDVLLLIKELERLSSWSEEDGQRTKVAAGAYFVAWIFHLTIPLLLVLFAVLIMFPESRDLLFPPESTYDPYTSKSEQVEAGTKSFLAGASEFMRRVAFDNLGISKGGGSDGPQPGGDQTYKDHQTGQNTKQRELQKGVDPEVAKERDEKASQAKRNELIEKYGRMLQDTLGFVADLSEVVTNAVSPPPLYPETNARLKLTLIFITLALVVAVTPAAVIARACSAGLGFAFFSRPVITRAWRQFRYYVPNWQQLIDPRNSVLHRVPDNQQYVMWILRGREYAHQPLPLFPELEEEEEEEQKFIEERTDEKVAFDREELREVEAAEEEKHAEGGKSRGKLSNLLHKQHGKNKESAKHGLRGVMGLQSKAEEPKLKWALKSKLTHGVRDALALADDGDITAFPAEYKSITGRIVIEVPEGERPPSDTKIAFFADEAKDDAEPMVRFGVEDMVELKKGEVDEGKTKILRAGFEFVAGHGLGLESLFIRLRKPNAGTGVQVGPNIWVTNVELDDPFEDDPKSWMEFSKVGRRDQLFMRVVALGNQAWEAY